MSKFKLFMLMVFTFASLLNGLESSSASTSAASAPEIAPAPQTATRFQRQNYLWGAHTVGNGGRGVSCPRETGPIESGPSETGPRPSSETFTLLEIVEAQQADPKYKVSLGGSKLNLEGKIELALNRLAKVSPARAEIYRKRATLIKTTVRMAPLVDVQDSEHVVLETGCELHQAAIQREAPLAGNPREYYFDRTWYPKLDLDSQAALFLHEIVYTEELETNNVENSLTTRSFVSSLISDQFEKLNVRQAEALFAGAGLDGIYTQGALLSYLDFTGERAGFSYYPNGIVQSAFAINGSSVTALGRRIRVSGLLQFFPNGKIEGFNPLEKLSLTLKAGNVAYARNLTLNANGSVKSFIVGNLDYDLRDARGAAHHVQTGDQVELDGEGYWLRGGD